MLNIVIPNIKTIILYMGADTCMKEGMEFKLKPMVLIVGRLMFRHIIKYFKNKFNYRNGIINPLSNNLYIDEEI